MYNYKYQAPVFADIWHINNSGVFGKSVTNGSLYLPKFGTCIKKGSIYLPT